MNPAPQTSAAILEKRGALEIAGAASEDGAVWASAGAGALACAEFGPVASVLCAGGAALWAARTINEGRRAVDSLVMGSGPSKAFNTLGGVPQTEAQIDMSRLPAMSTDASASMLFPPAGSKIQQKPSM